MFECALQYLMCTGGKPLNNKKKKMVSKVPLKSAPLSRKTRLVDKNQINFICFFANWPLADPGAWKAHILEILHICMDRKL